jgi:hypothetical protein
MNRRAYANEMHMLYWPDSSWNQGNSGLVAEHSTLEGNPVLKSSTYEVHMEPWCQDGEHRG